MQKQFVVWSEFNFLLKRGNVSLGKWCTLTAAYCSTESYLDVFDSFRRTYNYCWFYFYNLLCKERRRYVALKYIRSQEKWCSYLIFTNCRSNYMNTGYILRESLFLSETTSFLIYFFFVSGTLIEISCIQVFTMLTSVWSVLWCK